MRQKPDSLENSKRLGTWADENKKGSQPPNWVIISTSICSDWFFYER